MATLQATRSRVDASDENRRLTLDIDWPVGSDFQFTLDGEISDTSLYAPSDSLAGLVQKVLQDNLRTEFEELANQWHEETGHLSSPVQIAMHESYQQIIAMGQPVISLILQDLEERGGQWYWALRALNKGKTPVTAAAAGNTRMAKAAWLAWGRRNGYVR